MKNKLLLNENEYKNFLDHTDNAYNISVLSLLDGYNNIFQIKSFIDALSVENAGEKYAVAYGNGELELNYDALIIKISLDDCSFYIINYDGISYQEMIKAVRIPKHSNMGIFELKKEFSSPVEKAKKAYYNFVFSSAKRNIFSYKPINYDTCGIEAETIKEYLDKYEFECAITALKKFEKRINDGMFTAEECFFVLNTVMYFVYVKFRTFNFSHEQWDYSKIISKNLVTSDTFDIVYRIISDSKKKIVFGQSYKYKSIINDIIVYINKNYDKQILLKDISEQFHIKSNYLSTLFKNVFGCNYTEYLTELRMKKARELLESTEYSVEEIGEMVGYTDYYSFIKSFKRNVGISPTVYRNNNDII